MDGDESYTGVGGRGAYRGPTVGEGTRWGASVSADCRVVIEPEWEEIERVRAAVTNVLAGEQADVVDALTMVASELTENALKYGTFAASTATVEVGLTRRARSHTVEVKNPVAIHADDHLRRLDVMIQWIRGHQDPFEAYLQRMEEVSRQNLESEESGLGLVRIAYEGRSLLDFDLDEHTTLAVSAVYLL